MKLSGIIVPILQLRSTETDRDKGQNYQTQQPGEHPSGISAEDVTEHIYLNIYENVLKISVTTTLAAISNCIWFDWVSYLVPSEISHCNMVIYD